MGNNRWIVKISFIALCFISLLVASCGLSLIHPQATTIVSTNTNIMSSNTPFAFVSTAETSSVQLPTTSPIETQKVDNEPRFIALLGEQTSPIFDRSLVFSPDGLILAQAYDNIKLWDVNSHKLIRELEYPASENPKATYYASKALFSPDGTLIAVSVTDYGTHLGSPNGRLLMWDVTTGELKQDWEQKYAIMSAYDGFVPEPRIYNIPVNAMTFFPSSTKLAYANGNRIEIKDAYSGEDVTGWSLGDKMYASEISIREDEAFLYILMKWDKDLTFPALYRVKFVAQIWHPSTKTLRHEVKFEEVYPEHANMWLVGQNLIYEDTIKSSLSLFDFSRENNKDLPYRIGRKFFNADANLMFVAHEKGDNVGIEIWNTDTWRNIHTFYPSFIDEWVNVRAVAFSPDNALLAMDYRGQVSLWDIRPSIQP